MAEVKLLVPNPRKPLKSSCASPVHHPANKGWLGGIAAVRSHLHNVMRRNSVRRQCRSDGAAALNARKKT
jgi:hypothetical protein